MAERSCRRCGKTYEGSHGSSLCPACVSAQRSTGNIKARTCRTCNATFPGGPRAYYCPDCRAERKKEAERRCKERKALGKTRSIGSTDLCGTCGKPYIVASGLQRFCDECARAQRNADALVRYHSDPDAVQIRRERRESGNPTVRCVICGKTFVRSGNWITCSRECSRAHADELKAQWIKEHPERRAELNRDWYRKFFESLSADELESYRARKRESARTSYHEKKEEA